MSNNPGTTTALPEETGKHLEASLKHLVEHSMPNVAKGEKDELARAFGHSGHRRPGAAT